MTQGLVLMLGVCACAVVFAVHGNLLAAAGFIAFAFFIWLGAGAP